MIIFLLVVSIIAAEDFYKTLELNQDASEQEIRKAFRKLSIQYHPDKNPGDSKAAQKFLEVNRAHEILTDPEKKMLYDLYGEDGINNPQYRNKQKGSSASAEIRVTLEELYNGSEREFTMNKKIICKRCKGSGSKDGQMKICKHCNGRGVRMQNVNMGIGFTVQMQVPCDKCGGKGKTTSGNCPECRGEQVISTKKILNIEIEKGMTDGQQIVFRGESEQHPDYLPGDVIFTLRQEKHPIFTRQGADLHMNLKITLKEAILGFKKSIRHLDNHYVQIESNEIIQPFQIKKISEEGMPFHQVPSAKGDLYIKYIVELPGKLTAEEKKFISQIF